jgi:phosphate transport system substrate-binding protein
MKNLFKKTGLIFAAMFGCIPYSCAESSDDKDIKNINFANYPQVDGSTSTKPLNAMVACKLLNIGYEWTSNIVGEWSLNPDQEDIPTNYSGFFGEKIKVSQTHGAFMNLIDGDADIILTHRTISPNEKAHADEIGVSLTETSIAIDAFVFIVNVNNPVRSLTVDQVQKIYTGEITNWEEVGGNDAEIQVFTRPRDSGSEEVMRELVMNGLEMGDFPESSEIPSMAGTFTEVRNVPNGICYTFNFYKDVMVRIPDTTVPKIAINGIFPSESTVKDGTYPFISKVHVAIRSDLDPNSTAYKLYEWLQTEAANPAITESGYIAKNNVTSMASINTAKTYIYPNPVKDFLSISSSAPIKKLEIYNPMGKLVVSGREVREKVDISMLAAGMYILNMDGIVSKFIKQQ